MSELLELLMSAKINFETLVKQNPQVEQHPLYAIAKMQLDEAIEKLKEEKTP